MSANNNNTLFLIFHGRFPGEKAASLFAAKGAEAFADEGKRVVMIVPRRLGRTKKDVFEYYSVRKNFTVVYLPIIDLFWIPLVKRVAFFVSFFTFSLSTFFYLLFRAKKEDIIYSNEWMPLWFASFVFSSTFYELHDFPESNIAFFGGVLRHMRWVLIHNRWKIERAKKLFSLAAEKILYQPNAVDIKQFDISIGKEDARLQLGLPKNYRIVVYTGHLYGWKGVQTLADAMTHMHHSVMCYFVGGTEQDVVAFKAKNADNKHITIVGHRSHAEIPLWQKAADVLVLPNTAKEDISKYYTSPMKLFEYMGSKRPIVASDIPSIVEIVTPEEAILVAPDDAEALAKGIEQALTEDGQTARVDRAFQKALTYTWEKRAKTILQFIGNSSWKH